jgi:D-beta-D-heptose 7-phosphate kinase/D-beta-D-heptose 1-phosphate adenosyltransferase
MSDTLIPLLSALSRHRVLVIGDAMLDRYIFGSVARISPEAPIPVLLKNSERTVLGGAGNVFRNLRALGVEATLLSIIADDKAGALLRADAESLGGTVLLQTVTDRPTGIKTRYLAGTQQLLRVDDERTGWMTAADETIFLKTLSEQAAKADVIVLSDYGKGVLSTRVCAAAIVSGKPVLVDPKGADYGRYRGAAYVTPNRAELEEAAGLPVRNNQEAEAAGQKLRKDYGFQAVFATRSEQGISILSETTAVHLPTFAREVFDVSGAGDTVVAALAAALASGADLTMAARLANSAAGIVVGKRGTATASKDELTHYLGRRSNASHKIYTAAEAASLRRTWREQGLITGFTNGCFDILHAGHVMMLNECRNRCDRLLVGLNSDASVKRLKGATRPVNSVAAREAVLAGLAAVDGVVVFEDDTPLSLIEALQPDRLFKGSDYTRDTVVGAALVESYGGRVELVELMPGVSTTNTLARLQL